MLYRLPRKHRDADEGLIARRRWRLINDGARRRQSSGASRVLTESIAIQQIAAPTFHEQHRAEYVQSRFADLGLTDVSRDDLSNVYAKLPGRASKPAVLISAHLDTVFPHGTDLTLNTDATAGKVNAAGIGDNSMGVAALFGLIWSLTLRA